MPSYVPSLPAPAWHRPTALPWRLLLLWTLAAVGLCGVHRLAVGRWKTGLLFLLTFGVFGVGQLWDLPRLRDFAASMPTPRGCHPGLRRSFG